MYYQPLSVLLKHLSFLTNVLRSLWIDDQCCAIIHFVDAINYDRMEMEFEYGYNLKIYPDDPIQVANKSLGGKSSGPSIGNWISNLLSPVDASGVAPPPLMEEK